MYVPRAFAVTDSAILTAFMKRNSFALLVSTSGNEPFATHLPFLYDPTDGPHGTLRGHLALPNPHAEKLASQPVLIVFSGPHAYVSPTWYRTPGTVPTWNYAAVHAYGTCELVTDADELMRILTEMVNAYESGMPSPWAFDPGDARNQALASGIVGVRIRLDRLEGKWKLNQNHPPDRRARVAEELEQSTDPAAREIAAMMRETIREQR